MESRVEKMLEIAHRIIEEDRDPTDEERRLFHDLEGEIEEQPQEWRDRFADLMDRLASALEGIGL